MLPMVAETKCIKLSDSDSIQKFEQVKRFIGLKNDAEVVRFLVNWFINYGFSREGR